MQINNSKIKQALLSGNEAVVRGALEAGVNFATTYPGTPASEIGDIFAKISKESNFYFEYSTNEKIALEAASGAAFSGLKSIVSMKHYGLNVALDSLLPLIYLECPLVVVISDDPGSWSSIQSEQDSRWFSRLGHLPTLEPADSQEALDMTKFAFEFTQKYKIPILIRLTTRVCHSRSLVKCNSISIENKIGKYIKKEFSVGTAVTLERHKNLFLKTRKLQDDFNKNNQFNFIKNGHDRKLGIVTSGVSYCYVREILENLNLDLPILKIGFSYPIFKNKYKEFFGQVNEILIVEELNPVLEREARRLLQEFGLTKKVYGKDLLPGVGELKPEYVLQAISNILKLPLPQDLLNQQKEFAELSIAPRPPILCAGCPHRSTFWMIKKAVGDQAVFGGDIGCYLIGALPPFKLADYIVSMGAGMGISHGVAKATGQKPVIFIGDSTFFHAGIPSLINMVYNQSDVLVVILDNRITAMTGHQPNPGVGLTGQGESTKALKIEEIVKACEVDNLEIINTFNIKESLEKIKKAYAAKGVSVVIAKGECRLLTVRRLTQKNINVPKFDITGDSDFSEFNNFKCPAIRRNEGGKYYIDQNTCWGCAVCGQIYPGKIHPTTKSKNLKIYF
ncbi:MAG: indolepyruvate ferredoxin oxidoreductase subunit alpha [Patescibacteria group bacterium]|nr:indolepyruvate ferredoxin oxidoreductase subunit alpha [Patescibacteria group bacterium]MDD5121633.1 indolepyruvate ferredoxin oxidoreductase subunit alpha [Patescibacteria group bacterium]MDD5221913.1 indolepyruvate ferredoxin oxidoreductase subunit alpha [Patescibacteria group bacterium]MDD5396203.1 indolepyruvate ferredoxin oxidoreductase subunit alpha [Patescibacteria group bacterium]